MSSAEIKSSLAKAYSAGLVPTLVSVAPSGRDEIWAVGDTAFVVPVVPNDAPPELEYGLRLRRESLLSGKCEQCDALPRIGRHGKLSDINVAETVFPHRRNCPASDESVIPQLEAYYNKVESSTVEEAFFEASRRTKEKLYSTVNGTDIQIENSGFKDWASSLLDHLLESSSLDRCGHLATNPAQTWNTLLGHGQWNCDECWEYFNDKIRNGLYRLPPVEDSSCDRCRRFVRGLTPLVIRIANFVLRGGLCRRCSQESQGGSLATVKEGT